MKVQRKLIKTSALFAFLICSAAVFCESPKKVNCRKYVYAPVCRGVGAKREVNDGRRVLDLIKHSLADDGEFAARGFRKPANTNDLDIQSLWKAIIRRAKELEYDPGAADY